MLLQLLVLMCWVVVVQSASAISCSDDSDCIRGNFCYLQTARCTACVDCKAYQRQPAAACAREPAQCGDCVNGFQSEILANGHIRELCIPLHSHSTAPPEQGYAPISHTASGPWWLLVIFVALLVASVILVLVLQRQCRQYFKVQWQTRLRCNDSQSSLSRTPFAPSAPPQSHAGDAELSRDEAQMDLTGFYYERESERCQKASKYLNPVWVRTHNNNNDPETEPSTDVVDGPPENAPFLIDENTLPSDWTPGTEYDGEEPAVGASSEGPLVTSFAGILQLNALATGPQPANHSAGPNAHDSNHDPNANTQSNNQQQFVTVTNIVINNGAPSATGIFNITQT